MFSTNFSKCISLPLCFALAEDQASMPNLQQGLGISEKEIVNPNFLLIRTTTFSLSLLLSLLQSISFYHISLRALSLPLLECRTTFDRYATIREAYERRLSLNVFLFSFSGRRDRKKKRCQSVGEERETTPFGN
jgi:hypothetical protein